MNEIRQKILDNAAIKSCHETQSEVISYHEIEKLNV